MDIRADLHIHTVLSPCGDLEMSPENILHFAQIQGLNMIGITDHNSTRQARKVYSSLQVLKSVVKKKCMP